MKLVNQAIVAGTLLGLANGAALARGAGFAPQATRDALAAGTAKGFLFDAYLTRMMGESGPVTFTLAMLRKDVGLARDEAHACGLDTAFLDAALAAVHSACVRHGETAGVQALSALAVE
jgi:3-hydroxyisobutyrate dehydrogenase-like beta-hydroxyacid dehydrogenase